MANRISWSKALRQSAAAQGKGLYAVACLTRRWRYEALGPMDHDLAEKLFHFGVLLCHGKAPQEAYNTVFGPSRLEEGEERP